MGHENEKTEPPPKGHAQPHPADTAAVPDDYLRALNTLGDCLARQGQTDEARRILTTSLDQSSARPDDDPIRAFALRLLRRLPGPRP